MRLFASVGVPVRHRESVALAVEPLKPRLPKARWTPQSSWHVTLRFFGEVADESLPPIREGIGRALKGAGSVDARLLGLGAFPTPRRARVLWVGVEDPQLRLAGMAAGIGAECGLVDERPLHPHLTLARLREPADLGPSIKDLTPLGADPEPFVIHRVSLLRSHMHSTGSRYEVLDSWDLSGGSGL